MDYDVSPIEDAGESGDQPQLTAPPILRSQPGYWDLLQLLIFALTSLGALVLLAGGAMAAFQRLTGDRYSFSEGPFQLVSMLVIQGVWWALILAFLYYATVLKYGLDFAASLAWKAAGSTARHLLAGVGLAIAVTALANVIPMPEEPSPLEELLANASQYLPLFMVFGVLIAPAVEEVVFRGFVYGVIERAHGVKAAVTVTAAVFAAPHSAQYGGRWQVLLILFLVGIALGVARARTGSSRVTTFIHAAYNATFMAALLAAQDVGALGEE